MRKNVIIVNTARGPIINEKDLVQALRNQRIYSAGLDLFGNEPDDCKNGFPFSSVLTLIDDTPITFAI